MGIKKFLKELYYLKIKKMSRNEMNILHLRKIGMIIGTDCWIFSDKIETAEPYLVTLGNHVTIATNVQFATHDASANFYLENVSDIYGRINIGNNVFIGMGSIVLPGVTIADNTIIGAGSVVSKSIKTSGMVVAGNPAKIICSIDELKKKNLHRKLNTWFMSFEEKKKYLLDNEDLFKKN